MDLLYAARHGYSKELQQAIVSGSNVNEKDVGGSDNGRSAIHMVADRGDFKSLRLLLQAGADAKAISSGGMTPLHHAAGNNRGDSDLCMQELIQAGADVNAKDSSKCTPLHYSARCGDEKGIQMLTGYGADVNFKNEDGNTPLHNAALKGHTESVQALCASGADVNAQNNQSKTPLHYAASQPSNSECAAILFKNGADSSMEDFSGNTPDMIDGANHIRDGRIKYEREELISVLPEPSEQNIRSRGRGRM